MATTLRLAAGYEGRRSRYWTFKPTRNRVGVYVSREGSPGAAHVSLHADQAWHLKVDGRYYPLPIADTMEPTGVRHAVRLLIGTSVCRIVAPAPRAELLELDPGNYKLCLAVDLFLLSKGGHVVAMTDSGPRRHWRLPLPDGYEAQLTATPIPAPENLTVTIDAPADAASPVPAGLADGTWDHMLVFGSAHGGAVTIVDADIRPSSP